MFDKFQIFFFLVGFLIPIFFYNRALRHNLKKIEFLKEKKEYDRQKKLAELTGKDFDINKKYEIDI